MTRACLAINKAVRAFAPWPFNFQNDWGATYVYNGIADPYFNSSQYPRFGVRGDRALLAIVRVRQNIYLRSRNFAMLSYLEGCNFSALNVSKNLRYAELLTWGVEFGRELCWVLRAYAFSRFFIQFRGIPAVGGLVGNANNGFFRDVIVNNLYFEDSQSDIFKAILGSFKFVYLTKAEVDMAIRTKGIITRDLRWDQYYPMPVGWGNNPGRIVLEDDFKAMELIYATICRMDTAFGWTHGYSVGNLNRELSGNNNGFNFYYRDNCDAEELRQLTLILGIRAFRPDPNGFPTNLPTDVDGRLIVPLLADMFAAFSAANIVWAAESEDNVQQFPTITFQTAEFLSNLLQLQLLVDAAARAGVTLFIIAPAKINEVNASSNDTLETDKLISVGRQQLPAINLFYRPEIPRVYNGYINPTVPPIVPICYVPNGAELYPDPRIIFFDGRRQGPPPIVGQNTTQGPLLIMPRPPENNITSILSEGYSEVGDGPTALWDLGTLNTGNSFITKDHMVLVKSFGQTWQDSQHL